MQSNPDNTTTLTACVTGGLSLFLIPAAFAPSHDADAERRVADLRTRREPAVAAAEIGFVLGRVGQLAVAVVHRPATARRGRPAIRRPGASPRRSVVRLHEVHVLLGNLLEEA